MDLKLERERGIGLVAGSWTRGCDSGLGVGLSEMLRLRVGLLEMLGQGVWSWTGDSDLDCPRCSDGVLGVGLGAWSRTVKAAVTGGLERDCESCS